MKNEQKEKEKQKKIIDEKMNAKDIKKNESSN
jgi:hypothetical protein